MKVHERIKQARAAVGLSQVKFAERMAISAGYLAEIETNSKVASERVIRLMVSEFSIDDRWLRTGEGEMFSSGMDAHLASIFSLYNSLDHQFKMCALNQMEELARLHSQLKADK